jgi:arylsulfatase
VVDGVAQQPVDGRSILPTFADADVEAPRKLQYFEMMGSRGLYLDGWKAVTNYVANQFDERSHIEGSFDFDTDQWSLFHLDEDFSESEDLAASEPARLRMMEETWWGEAGRNQVLPLYEFPASMAHMHPGELPAPARATYAPGGGPIIESQLPALMGGFSLTAHVEVADGDSGVLTALGDRHGGWAFYLLDGVPVATFALLNGTVRVAGSSAVPAGAHQLGLRYRAGREPVVVLSVDGSDVGEAPLPGLVFFPNLSTAGAGMLVGRDRGLPVSDDYRPPFAFTGTLSRVELASGNPAARVDDETAQKVALAAD